MSLRAVECDENDTNALESMIVDTSTGKESGAAARVRRDSKKALDKRVSSVSCGAEVMLSTPIVGKVIRMWGEWYSLCCFCGCFVRFYPNNRAGSQICSTRCDFAMLYRSAKPATTGSCTTAEAPRCRFCSKQDPMRTGSRWHMVKAPMDATGHNANPSSSTADGLLLPTTLSALDTGVYQDDANASDILTHCLRSPSVLR
jgi:hypothetical protein